jgi:hypothetical protein
MSTTVFVNTYTHSVAYVTDKLLTSIKNIIRLSGLNPGKLTQDWEILERGINRWLDTEDLEEVHLEVFNPNNNKLVGRWDFEIFYGFSADGATFWLDPDVISYHIKKQGLWPSSCDYRIVVTTKPGRPDVLGWSNTTLRSIDGFIKQSIGTTINGGGLNASAGYWRKIS